MRFIAARELKNQVSRVLDRLAREDMVVTRNGKPAAALIRLNEDTIEDFIVAHHPTLLGELESSLREYRRKGGIGHDAMKRRIERNG